MSNYDNFGFKESDFDLSGYYLNAELYDLQNFDILEDINFYINYAKKINGTCLELACGTGRVAIPVLKSGIDVYGIDLSKEFIQSIQKKIKNIAGSDRFSVADMRNFKLNKKFDLIYIPFNAFLHLYTIADIENCLGSVREHLTDNGSFIFDIINPSVKLLARNPEKNFLLDDFPLSEDNQSRCQVFERNRYDYKTQLLYITWKFEYPDSEMDRVFYLEMRMIFPQELDALLKYNGFKISNKFGNFNEQSFKSESAKQICICHKL